MNFNLELNNLPNSIKRIEFIDYGGFSIYNKKLNNLPNSIEYIKLPDGYKFKITNKPTNLKKIKCKKYEFVLDFWDVCDIELD